MLEMFYRTAILDFGWWINLITGNLLWFFMFVALFYYFVDKKFNKDWLIFAVEFFAIWAFFDAMGWQWFTTAFPFLFFAFHAVMRILVKNTSLQKFAGAIGTAFLFISSAIIN